jgi:threonine aldolase
LEASDVAGLRIDLRSDTLTQPTPEMRQAMANAEVGDDVFGEDPTVLALEARTAELLGKEAAVYMPSAVMTNQVAVRVHTRPGDELFCDANAHIHFYESGAPAALSGVTCHLLAGVRGIFSADDLRAAIRPANVQFPAPALVCLENTHNRGGGSVWSLAQTRAVAEVAREAHLKMHLDGARLWNAALASGTSEASYAACFDSVSVCFSKGLGAPVGSALAGDGEFIAQARRVRKRVGGGMRQAGIIAAGALYALQHHRGRLIEDHRNARSLAEALAKIDGIDIDPSEVQTNIVLFRTGPVDANALAARLAERGVGMLARDAGSIRAVTSLMVTEAMVAEAAAIVAECLR